MALFRLVVARDGPTERVHPPETLHRIDCVAFREVADRLNLYGEAGSRVNLEGHLHHGPKLDESGQTVQGLSVYVDQAYLVDPAEETAGFVRLPVPVLWTDEPREPGHLEERR